MKWLPDMKMILVAITKKICLVLYYMRGYTADHIGYLLAFKCVLAYRFSALMGMKKVG